MNKYHIRFNKSRGQPSRGSRDHVWRVFENGKEYIVKHIRINVPCYDEATGDGTGSDDWNFSCEGFMTVDRETSTVTINAAES